jgi:hypothetical protein
MEMPTEVKTWSELFLFIFLFKKKVFSLRIFAIFDALIDLIIAPITLLLNIFFFIWAIIKFPLEIIRCIWIFKTKK